MVKYKKLKLDIGLIEMQKYINDCKNTNSKENPRMSWWRFGAWYRLITEYKPYTSKSNRFYKGHGNPFSSYHTTILRPMTCIRNGKLIFLFNIMSKDVNYYKAVSMKPNSILIEGENAVSIQDIKIIVKNIIKENDIRKTKDSK